MEAENRRGRLPVLANITARPQRIRFVVSHKTQLSLIEGLKRCTRTRLRTSFCSTPRKE